MFLLLQKAGQTYVIRTINKHKNLSFLTNLQIKRQQAANSDRKESKLKNEKIIITNCEGGLGTSLAVKFAKQEAKVALWDKDKDALFTNKHYVKSITGYDINTYCCDLSKKADIYKVAEESEKDLGHVTMVINTVSVSSEKLLMDISDDDLENAFNTNIMSNVWQKAFLPNMIEANKGRFVSISSMAGHVGFPKLSDYCAASAANINFMTALRSELESEGCTGIKTTSVCPYFLTNTNLHKNAQLRFIRGVSKNEVVERTIRAIIKNESVAFIPRWFKIPISFRWFCPNYMSRMMKTMMIKDTNTESASIAPVVTQKAEFEITCSPVCTTPPTELEKEPQAEVLQTPPLSVSTHIDNQQKQI